MLVPTKFILYDQELRMSGEDSAAEYKGSGAVWAVDPATEAETATFLMMTSWDNSEAEQLCENTLLAADGSTMKEACLEDMLREADPGAEVYHVAWELITQGIMEWWMDSENPVWPYDPPEIVEE